MSITDTRIVGPARRYLDALELPVAPFDSAFEETAEAAPTFVAKQQAWAVGSQLVEFNPEVQSGLRSNISNCILLAQLAANKATDEHGDTFVWYAKYSEVLYNLGWTLLDMDFQVQEIADKNSQLHKAILPVVQLLLGPKVAAASLIMEVLKGLQSMDQNRPWIRMFEQESRRFEARQFQLSYTDLEQSGQPRITLLCFSLEVNKDIDQVLFFKFTDEKAVLRKYGATLGINLQVLKDVEAELANKLSRYVTSYIKDIEI